MTASAHGDIPEYAVPKEGTIREIGMLQSSLHGSEHTPTDLEGRHAQLAGVARRRQRPRLVGPPPHGVVVGGRSRLVLRACGECGGDQTADATAADDEAAERRRPGAAPLRRRLARDAGVGSGGAAQPGSPLVRRAATPARPPSP